MADEPKIAHKQVGPGAGFWYGICRWCGRSFSAETPLYLCQIIGDHEAVCVEHMPVPTTYPRFALFVSPEGLDG